MKVYSYTSTYQKKDGSLSVYRHVINYNPKKKEISDQVKKEIINKRKLGVTKTRLRQDYNLSQKKLDDILSTAE